MITLHEGLGGWTIEVRNGEDSRRFECTQFVITDKRGLRWFDFDAAIAEAKKYDKEHNHVSSHR